MKFTVERASDKRCERKPCDGARLEKQWVDHRGAIHRIWSIEIHSVEQLLEPKEPLIIGDEPFYPKFPEYEKLPLITIYDDYVE